MKKYLFSVLLLLVFSLSCGGGGGGGNPALPPSTRDLSGLEGVWDAHFILDMTITVNGETESETMALDTVWTVTQNGVQGEGGAFQWSYNGTTLSLMNSLYEQVNDPDCGTITLSGNAVITIPLAPGATSGPISGNANVSLTTTSCGSGSGTCIYSGTITRR